MEAVRQYVMLFPRRRDTIDTHITVEMFRP
jgi:hypothetical protein